MGLVLTIKLSAEYFAAYTLRIKVVDPHNQPMPNVAVNYTTCADPQCTWIGRYSPAGRVSCVTDEAGCVVIHTYDGHDVDMTLQYPGYRNGSLFLAAAGSNFPHQLEGIQNISVSTSHDGASNSGNLSIPAEKAIALEVTIEPAAGKR